MERRTGDIREWFSQQLNTTESGCWEWTRCLSRKGYGQFRLNGRTTYTHRYVLEEKLGRAIRAGYMACHSCNNRKCCNPDHIREGSAKENTQDMVNAGRQATGDAVAQRGEKHGMSKLTESQVRVIRETTGSVREVARAYGISPGTVSSIRLRKTWAHLPSSNLAKEQ
jgi:hypothetical protein